ncbi:TonB-dependent receptor [Dyadobacter alkalitolerans]|uniref:TonB-dependent receptor n=1 Tax=Dyadobacter alkalitolerans TaxID=492736 RepID=UPI000415B355|nr:carboxypeptidase-like regulatory domain-containing protein [Dyadobacter alkalitolerans]
MRINIFIALWLASVAALGQKRITISGFVKEKGSQELLTGANVYVPGTSSGATTNNYAFYSLTISAADSVSVTYSLVGYESQTIRISAQKDTELNVYLPSIRQLDEVTISARKQEDNVSSSAQMSVLEIPIDQIKKIPSLLGEKDVLKGLQLMPGVQKGTEGQTGLYVRGGGPDQNLIILDDAVVYNASHLFGFFSVFNSDAIKRVELTKGGFPARYGGRLSSVVEMDMKEGNKEKLHGEGGIGLISSRLTLEGPIKKNKSSFLISGRRTYLDVLAGPYLNYKEKHGGNGIRPGYYFYDLNAKVNYDLGTRDKLYVSGYLGKDKLSVKKEHGNSKLKAGLNWGNATATMRWNHVFNRKLFANTALIFTNFNFATASYTREPGVGDGSPATESRLKYHSRIQDLSFKSDFDFYPNAAHAIKFGIQGTRHKSTPSALAISDTNAEGTIDPLEKPLYSLEGGAYVEDTWQPFDALKMNLGFRMSYFKADKKTYLNPEPRFSTALKLAPDFSAKASYARMNQYVHLLSNTGLGLPTDLWVTSTDRIAPQQSSQVALGLAKDLHNKGLTITLEGFYKDMKSILSYREGASFLGVNGENANDVSWQDNVTSGKGWSYGSEFLIQKKSGKFSGWVGYTLSWIYWKFPELNNGQTFHPRYDRRHDVSVVGIYELNKRVTISASWVYGTGNALTVPAATFYPVSDNFFTRFDPSENILNSSYRELKASEFPAKNSFRAEAFHRLDLAIQFHKKKKRHERTWEFSVYNAYNRKNPFFYDRSEEKISESEQKSVLKKYSLFPVVPSVIYNFKF